MNIKTRFNYKEYVSIKDLTLTGRIIEILISSDIVYKVSYWIEGENKIGIFYEDELEKQ